MAELTEDQLQEDLAKAWSKLNAGKEEQDETRGNAPDDTVDPVVVPLRRGPRQRLWELAKVAGWIVAIGVLLWHMRVLHLLQPLTQPDAAPQRIVLLPDDLQRTRGIGGSVDHESAGRLSKHLLLEITSESFLEPESFELEILKVDATGEQLVWKTTEVKQTAGGGFNLLVPRKFLDPGTYRVVVSGRQEGKQEEMASYRFTLEDTGAATADDGPE